MCGCEQRSAPDWKTLKKSKFLRRQKIYEVLKNRIFPKIAYRFETRMNRQAETKHSSFLDVDHKTITYLACSIPLLYTGSALRTGLSFFALWMIGNIMRITRQCSLISLSATVSQKSAKSHNAKGENRQVSAESATCLRQCVHGNFHQFRTLPAWVQNFEIWIKHGIHDKKSYFQKCYQAHFYDLNALEISLQSDQKWNV